jgi:hypothetical protein
VCRPIRGARACPDMMRSEGESHRPDHCIEQFGCLYIVATGFSNSKSGLDKQHSFASRDVTLTIASLGVETQDEAIEL